MKISLITSVFNCEDFIGDCIESVKSQDYLNLEHIIIDGNSTDHTSEIIAGIKEGNILHKRLADKGFYDGLNIGLEYATGEIIGVLNADDRFVHDHVISDVMRCFEDQEIDLVYGDIYYTDRIRLDKITRIWRAGHFNNLNLLFGWVPPHSSLFFRVGKVNCKSPYSLKFGTCADYEFMLKLFYVQKLKSRYLQDFLVSMRAGGVSNGSFTKYWRSFINDFKILRTVKLPIPIIPLFFKRVRKLNQFLG